MIFLAQFSPRCLRHSPRCGGRRFFYSGRISFFYSLAELVNNAAISGEVACRCVLLEILEILEESVPSGITIINL